MTDNRFDLVIVGGGIVGAMIAWRILRRRPDWRTLWLDRSLFGFGASAYSGGLITPYGRTPVHRALAISSAQLFQEITAQIGPVPMRELVAWLAISSDRRVEATSWFISGHAISVDTKITEDLGRSVPSLQLPIGDILMGPFQVRHGWPADLIARIKELCRTAPLFSIWEGVALDGWSSSGDFIHLSLTLAEPVVTRRLALATGPWAIAGAPPEVRSKRVAACHLEVPPTDNAPVVLFGDHDAFLLPLPNEKRWLFSFASPIWDVAPESSHCMSADDDQISEHILKKYVPRLAPYRRGGRVFCDAYSPDRAPQVVCASGQANVIFVGASSGSGYRLAPGMADRAVDLLEVV